MATCQTEKLQKQRVVDKARFDGEIVGVASLQVTCDGAGIHVRVDEKQVRFEFNVLAYGQRQLQ